MSRTYKTRPEWVKLNDPKFPTKEYHQHYVIKKEKSGKTEVRTRHRWVGPPLYTIPEEYEVPHYYTWVEAVPCTIDVPEVSWREERHRFELGKPAKLCDKRPLIREGCSCCSRSYAKKLSAKSQRASINQQLHNAVRDYGWTTDTDEWYDVDITSAGVAEDWDFWD